MSDAMAGIKRRKRGVFSLRSSNAIGDGVLLCIPDALRNIRNNAGGGVNNSIGDAAGTNSGMYGVIVGGGQNCIDASGADTTYGFIGGGNNNYICNGTCFSSIIGGQNNVVSHNWATVSGYNVTTNQDCAFHANILVSQSMPIGSCVGSVLAPPLGSPTGTLWYYPDPVFAGVCRVYIV